LAGAYAGIEAIPTEWIRAIPDAQIALKIAERFLRY
jgi:ADP-ribosylglycohydrolase